MQVPARAVESLAAVWRACYALWVSRPTSARCCSRCSSYGLLLLLLVEGPLLLVLASVVVTRWCSWTRPCPARCRQGSSASCCWQDCG